MSQTQGNARLVFIEALTPLHPGLGRGGDFVDLPVQKDEFGFPTIWSSSLKGAMKSTKYLSCNNKTDPLERSLCRREVLSIFGPETDEASDYASAVTILDARLILIPARTLKGVWTYVTSPHLLNYLLTYMEVTNHQKKNDLASAINDVKKTLLEMSKVLVSKGELIANCKIILNEVEYEAKNAENIPAVKSLIDIFPKGIQGRIQERGLVIASDDFINDIVRRSLIIQPRIRLNYETKTVVSGGLWEEEYLPQFTVLVTAFICRSIRASEDQVSKWADKDVNRKDYGNISDEEFKKIYEDLKNKYRNKYKEEIINKYRNPDEVCNYIVPITPATQATQTEQTIQIMLFGGKETIGKGITRLIPG